MALGLILLLSKMPGESGREGSWSGIGEMDRAEVDVRARRREMESLVNILYLRSIECRTDRGG